MTPTPDPIAAIERALEGVTSGPWFVSGVRFRMDGSEWHSVNRYDDAKKRDEGIACVSFDPRTGEGLADARFIAACNPVAITSLLSLARQAAEKDAEIARLKGIGSAHDLINDWIVEGTEDLPDDTGVTIKIGERSIILDELGNLRRARSLTTEISDAGK